MLSETHSVGLVILGKGEAGTEVLAQDGVLGVLDVLEESSIDGLLKDGAFSVNHLLLGTFGKESLGIRLDSLLVTGEELVLDLGDINAGNGDLGAGGDSVNLVNALKRNTIDLVGSGNEEET